MLNAKRALFLLLFLLFSQQTLFAKGQNILIINSYHRGFVWSDLVIEGIESAIYKNQNNYINVLYMDSKRINTDEYYDKLTELYKIQLKNQKYDLVIAVDNFAYEFVLEKYSELFTDEPILFSGLERFDYRRVVKKNLEDRVYGVFEKRAFEDIFSIISTMIPNLKKLYVINDLSKNGEDSLPFIEEAIDQYKDKFQIELIRSSTIEELNTMFAEKTANEAVFFVRFYNDKDGNMHSYNEIASMINKSNLPVFVTDTLFIDKGAIGGKLVLIRELGKLTGDIALDIIEGRSKTPFTTTADSYSYMFDKNKLNQFNLSPYSLNRPVNVINLPETFFDKHRDFINFVFVLTPVFAVLFLILLYNILKRLDSEKKLAYVEMEKNKHKQFVIQQSKLAEIGEVFSSIAHQWKNPLVEISTIAQEQAFTHKDKKSNKFVEEIMAQVKFMTETINAFQRFIMPSSEKVTFNMEEAINSTIKIIEHTIKYSYLDIIIDKSKAKNLVVFGYKNEFMQTLLNIINNAKDQILEQKKRGFAKKGQIKFYMYNEQKNIILEICDNGGGVKEWMLDKIFEEYFTTKINGHGIGLYMSKLIIEDKMGGKIEAFNKDEGLCFKITLGNVK